MSESSPRSSSESSEHEPYQNAERLLSDRDEALELLTPDDNLPLSPMHSPVDRDGSTETSPQSLSESDEHTSHQHGTANEQDLIRATLRNNAEESQFQNSRNQPSFSQTATNFPTFSVSRVPSQASGISDKPPPDASNTLRHPAQTRMLEMLKTYDLPAILDEVRRLDQQYAPKLEQSRIKNHDFDRQGLLFLAATEQLFLEQLLTCTAPWTVVDSGTGITVDQLKQMRKDTKVDLAPGIYMNLIAREDGIPLARDEMLLCLDAFEHMVHGGHDEAKFRPQGDDTNAAADADDSPEDSITLREGVKAAFRELRPKETKTSKEDLAKTLNFTRNAKSSATAMIKAQRDLINDAGENIIYFPFGGEAGWANKLLLRLRQHQKYSSSNQALVLMPCIARHLFPDYGIMLHQFSIFVLHPSQAALGESIMSHLTAAYPKYGGFNFATAGISVYLAIQVTSMLWTQLQYEFHRNGQGIEQVQNLQRVDKLYRKRVKDMQAKERRVNLRAEILASVDEQQNKGLQNTRSLRHESMLLSRLEVTTAELEQIGQRFAEDEEDAILNVMEAVRIDDELVNALEASVGFVERVVSK